MPSRLIDARIATVSLACVLAYATAGCAKKTVHAAAPVSAAPLSAEAERPMNTAPDTDATPPAEVVASPPPLPAPATPPPPTVVIQSPKPAAPRRTNEEPSAAGAEPEQPHPPAPQISPELSPGDQASIAHKIADDTSVAEKNLQETSGKQLNPAQLDLIAKIRSFLSQSSDASKDGDWARAQNLAQKARLLSVELINSF
jgi:hypothetical protein